VSLDTLRGMGYMCCPILAEDNGVLRCRHGRRLIVLYGRGVATV
jgi:hypothetical protein